MKTSKKIILLFLTFCLLQSTIAQQSDIAQHIKEGNVQLLKSYFESEDKYQDFIKNFVFSTGSKKLLAAAQNNAFYRTYTVIPYQFLGTDNGAYKIKNTENDQVFSLRFTIQNNAKGRAVITDFALRNNATNARTASASNTSSIDTLAYNVIELPYLKNENGVSKIQFPEYFLSLNDGFKNTLGAETASEDVTFSQINFTPLKLEFEWCEKILFVNVCGTKKFKVQFGTVLSGKDVPGNETEFKDSYFGTISDATAFIEPFNANYTQFSNYLLTSVVTDVIFNNLTFIREGLNPWQYGNKAGEYSFYKPIAVNYINGYLYVLDAGNYYNLPEIKVLKINHTADGEFSVSKIGIINNATYNNITFNKPNDIAGYKNLGSGSAESFLLLADDNGLSKIPLGANGMPDLALSVQKYDYFTHPTNDNVDYQTANIIRIDAYENGTTMALTSNNRIFSFFNEYDNTNSKIKLSHVTFVADTFQLSNLAFMQTEEKWYVTDFKGKLHILDKYGRYLSNSGTFGKSEYGNELYYPVAISPNPISDVQNPYRYRFIVANKWGYETGFKLFAPNLCIPKIKVFESVIDEQISVAFITSGKWNAVEFATGVTMENVMINNITVPSSVWDSQITPGVVGNLGNELNSFPNIFSFDPRTVLGMKRGWNNLKINITLFKSGLDANNDPVPNENITQNINFFWLPTNLPTATFSGASLDDYAILNKPFILTKNGNPQNQPCVIYKNIVINDKMYYAMDDLQHYFLENTTLTINKGGTLLAKPSGSSFSNFAFDVNGSVKVSNEGYVCIDSPLPNPNSKFKIPKSTNFILAENYFIGKNPMTPFSSILGNNCESACIFMSNTKLNTNFDVLVTINGTTIDLFINSPAISYHNVRKYEVFELDNQNQTILGAIFVATTTGIFDKNVNLRTLLGISFKNCKKYKVILSIGCNSDGLSAIEWFSPTEQIFDTRPLITLPAQTNYCDRPRPLTLTGFGPLPPNGFRTNSTPGTAFWSGTNITRDGRITVNANLPINTPIAYTYTYTDVLGCNNFATTTITVQTIPSAPIVPKVRVCEGNDLVLSITGNFCSSYVFKNPEEELFSTFANFYTFPNVTLDQAGVYSVTGFVRGCESLPRKVTVIVNSLPGLSIFAPVELCFKSPRYVLTAQPNGGTFSGMGVQKIGNRYFFIASVAGFGVHSITYTYTSPATKCSNATSSTITVGPMIAFGPAERVCMNEPAFVPSVASPLGGVWSKNSVALLNNLFTPSGANIGTHILMYNYTSPSGCVNTASKIITIVGLPAAPEASNNGPVCQNENVVLRASTIAGATYQWTNASNNYSISIQNPTIAGIQPTQAGVYTLRALKDGCFSAITPSSMTTVTVFALPTITISSLAGVCFNANAVDLSILPSPSTGVWTGTGVVSNNFVPNITNVGINKIIYSYTDANNCTNTKSANITVLPAPVVAILTSTPTTVCATNFVAATFVADPTGNSYPGPFVFQWARNGTNITTATGQSLKTSESGLYSLSATGLCGVAVAERNLSISTGIVQSGVISISGNLSICPNSKNTFSLPFDKDAKYHWEVNGSAILENANANICTILGLNTGIFKLEAKQMLDCITFTTTMVGNINTTSFESPTITSAVNSAICSYEAPFKIEALPIGGLWSGSGISADGIFTPQSFLPKFNTLTYTTTNGCEQKSASVVFEVNTSPSVNKEWATQFDIPFYITNYSIDFDVENNLYILSSGGGYRYYNCNLSTFAVTKIGTNGIQKWQNVYNPDNLSINCGINLGTSGSRFSGVEIVSNKNFGTWVLGKNTTNNITTNILIKYDSYTGTPLWSINLNIGDCGKSILNKGKNGDLYVSCQNENLVTKINNIGEVVFTISDINSPIIKTDIYGNLYVAGGFGATQKVVRKYSSSNNEISTTDYLSIPLIETDDLGNFYSAENIGNDLKIIKKDFNGEIKYTKILSNKHAFEIKSDKKGNIYIKSFDGSLIKLNYIGNQVWSEFNLVIGNWILDNYGNIYSTNGSFLQRINGSNGSEKWRVPVTLSVPNFPGLPNKVLFLNHFSLKTDNFSNVYTLGNYFDKDVYYAGNNFATKYSQCGSSPYNNTRMTVLDSENLIQDTLQTTKNLIEVYPNPFTGFTSVKLEIDQNESYVTLSIYDLLGRKLNFDYKQILSKGKHTIDIDSNELGLSQGTYILNCIINGKSLHLKLIKE